MQSDRILLVSCSNSKSSSPGKAREVYTGALTRLGIEYAERFGLTPLIVSGKYGIIGPDTWIEPYDLRKKDPLREEDYPSGRGFWLGDSVYFRHSPNRFKRLLPKVYNQTYGMQKSLLMRCLKDNHEV